MMNISDQLFGVRNAQASRVAGTGRAVCLPGTGLPERAACTIDLSGAGPQVPTVVIAKHEVTGPVLLAHTRDFHDDGAVILVDPRPVLPGPDGTAAADACCSSCMGAKPFIARGGHQTWIILQHRPGCRELAALAELCGVAP